MFLVASDLFEMFVFYRGKHTNRRSTVGIWSEVRVYRTLATNMPWAGVLRLGKFPDNRRLMCSMIDRTHLTLMAQSIRWSWLKNREWLVAR